MLVNRDLCLYFDSFGRKIQNRQLINYLAPSYQYVIYNSVQIQHDLSDYCGLFCVLFVKLVDSLKDFEKFLHLFNRNNLHCNDLIIDEINIT